MKEYNQLEVDERIKIIEKSIEKRINDQVGRIDYSSVLTNFGYMDARQVLSNLIEIYGKEELLKYIANKM